jgi:hypothetical protein
MQVVSASQPAVRWHVVGFEEKVYQACPGAPVQAGGCCEKCGQGIRYVVTVRSTDGRTMQVGQDCAVTLHGGPELAAVRSAERAWEHAQWLKSPAYAAQQARLAEDKRAREAAAVSAETEHALLLHGLRSITASPNCREVGEKDLARAHERSVLDGRFTGLDEDCTRALSLAWHKAQLPTSSHFGFQGDKVTCKALFEAQIPIDTQWGRSYLRKFRSVETGAVFVWFSGSHAIYGRLVGEVVTIRGTVKGHKHYEGAAETELSRCTFPGLVEA